MTSAQTLCWNPLENLSVMMQSNCKASRSGIYRVTDTDFVDRMCSKYDFDSRKNVQDKNFM